MWYVKTTEIGWEPCTVRPTITHRYEEAKTWLVWCCILTLHTDSRWVTMEHL